MNRALARGARGARSSDGASSLHRRELTVSSVHHCPVSHALDCSSSTSSRASALSASSSSASNLFAGVNRRAVRRMSRTAPVASSAVAAPQSAAMKTVTVDLGDRAYPIYIGPGLLEQGELLRKHIPGKRVLIVTNETIAPLYLDK